MPYVANQRLVMECADLISKRIRSLREKGRIIDGIMMTSLFRETFNKKSIIDPDRQNVYRQAISSELARRRTAHQELVNRMASATQ